MLLFLSTGIDYFSALRINKADTATGRKVWLWSAIVINVGLLCFFKYYNFFSASFADAISLVGFKANPVTLNIILPVGISFYTFHGLSYIIDVYKKRIEPERNFVVYSVFVSFFPLLVAGPIERATHLLPQIKSQRVFSYTKAIDGLRQILWGLFKKVVIADNCAKYANLIFENYNDYSGSTLVLGAVFFAFQIYGDFSGYSDMALGIARLFGIELLRNFAFPYFSRDIAEFWRRWHISLSSWFKDYLYIPLGGSRGGNWMKVRNTFIIFIVSGLWHGANWTFLIWGLLNAIYFVPLLLRKKNRDNLEIVAKGQLLPSAKDAINILATFCLTVFAWIFFRAENLNHAFGYIKNIFSPSFFTIPEIFPVKVISLIATFIFIEWAGRENKYALETIGISWPRPIRFAAYYVLLAAIIFIGEGEQPFIYFQF